MNIIKNAFLLLTWITSVLTLTSDCASNTVDYSDDRLIEIKNLNKRLLQVLLSHESLDEWSLNTEAKSGVFRVHKDQLKAVQGLLKETKARMSIKSGSVQDLIDQERSVIMEKSSSDDWFGSFRTIEEITEFYRQLAAENPTMIRLVKEIGRSYEGRSIFALHLTAPKTHKRREEEESEGEVETEEPSKPEPRKKKPNKIWVQCLIHAREWISGSTCQYIAQELVSGYANGDESIRSLLDSTEVIMVPVVNPDGYEHTWKRDRLWRKNRHPFRFGTGVDLNRNFAEEHWCKVGASNVPFADTYCGPSAGSEPETRALQTYYKRFAGRIAAVLDVHSFSQLILRPSGHTNAPCPDEAKLLTASELMADAIESIHGISYVSKRSAELYPTTGSATDYYYSLPGQLFRPYSVALELRPGPENAMQGFLLDPKEIRPCVEEVMAGFMAFVKFALENPLEA